MTYLKSQNGGWPFICASCEKCCLETPCYQREPNTRLEKFPDSRFVTIICSGKFQCLVQNTSLFSRPSCFSFSLFLLMLGLCSHFHGLCFLLVFLHGKACPVLEILSLHWQLIPWGVQIYVLGWQLPELPQVAVLGNSGSCGPKTHTYTHLLRRGGGSVG